MTKSVRFIFIFILILISALLIRQQISAEYLIRPIPVESGIRNYPPEADQPWAGELGIRNNMSFGKILQGSSSPTQSNSIQQTSQADSSGQNKALMETVRNLLARYQGEAAEKLEEFNQESETRDQKSGLMNRLSDLVTTPVPTLHPKLEKILADEKNKQFSYQAIEPFEYAQGKQSNTQVSNLSNLQPTTYNLQPVGDLLQNPKKTHYKIALLGDSMIDTLGKDLPHLKNLLSQDYPDYTFELFNYGQGGTDMESGLNRLTNTTSYLGVDYPPLLSHKPDILVIESFAYNHWSGQFFDLDRQWLTIAKIIDTVRLNSPNTKIILAATIAPNTNTFGDGKLNWPKQLKWDSATITKGYLQNLVNFATSEHYPLADAYHPSMDGNGDGKEVYINQGDHLHPSASGALLFSKKIVDAIKENNFVQ